MSLPAASIACRRENRRSDQGIEGGARQAQAQPQPRHRLPRSPGLRMPCPRAETRCSPASSFRPRRARGSLRGEDASTVGVGEASAVATLSVPMTPLASTIRRRAGGCLTVEAGNVLLEGERGGVFEVAAYHVDDLVDGADVNVPRVLVLVVDQLHHLGAGTPPARMYTASLGLWPSANATGVLRKRPIAEILDAATRTITGKRPVRVQARAPT